MSIEQILQLSIRLVLDCQAKHITVAYSGGADSHVLLHVVAKLRHEFPQHHYLAKHIHHGLSEHADQWALHCQRTCVELGIDFVYQKVEVDLDSNDGLEAAARDARYKALLQEAKPNTAILLAHHIDDQLETFLLQLKRGAGPKGLSAMPVESIQANQTSFIRPFLMIDKAAIGRNQIEQYAKANELDWIEDESNLNTRFDRNFLRQRIIPNLTQRWPELASAVQRSARLCAQQQQLLEQVVADKLSKMMDSRKRLNTQSLLQCSRLWQAQILRCWLDTVGASMPSEAVLTEVQQILVARQDANPVVRWRRWQVRRFQNRLYCLTDFVQQQPQNRPLKIGEKTQLADELGWVRVENLADCKSFMSSDIRFGGYAMKFKPQGEKFSKPIKQWFQRWQIEPWCRHVIPLVYIDDELVAILLEGKTIYAEKGTTDANESLRKSLKRGNSMPL